MDLSIITPVAPDRCLYLSEAQRSVNRLRELLDVEWIVAWDGQPTMSVEADVEIIGRAQSGISCTRNLALAKTTADFVTTLDADDLIEAPGAVAAIECLNNNPVLGWVGLSRTDTSNRPLKHSISDVKSFSAGELSCCWSAPFLFHPNSFVARRELIQRCGGWPAIPANEDLGMILRISEESAGVIVPEVLTRYRVWDCQEVARPDYVLTKRIAFMFIEAWINAVRSGYKRSEIVSPNDPGDAFGRKLK